MHPMVKAKLANFLKQFEGRHNHMYLDVKGLVTIGVGHLIDPVQEALKLKFRTKGGSAAGPAEVKKEWATVKSRRDLIKKGGKAFAAITNLELSDSGISKMLDIHAGQVEKYFKTNPAATKYYGKFDSWPADAQMALLGIAWGIMPLPQFGWKKFPEACRQEDWKTASKECRIKDAPDGRNRAHKLMFENAAHVKADGGDVKQLHWPAILIRQVNIR